MDVLSPLPTPFHPSNTRLGVPATGSLQSTQSTDTASSRTTSLIHPRTEREKMLSGEYYLPYDRELVLERKRCDGACWRFNNSTNPSNSVSREERLRLFQEILQPKELINLLSALASPTLSGWVGTNVVVEAPFNCDYGYNIHIGNDVIIHKNCKILDAYKVMIGDRCVLGPNVIIYTTTLPTDPKKRVGPSGPNLGNPIVIEEDCWIGGGVIILPGQTIKRGSTVGAGSIVARVCSIISSSKTLNR